MKKFFGIIIATFLVVTMYTYEAQAASTPLSQQPEGSVYRFWSQEYKKHVMTMSYEEANLIHTTNPAWQYDGVVFRAFSMGEQPDNQLCTQELSPTSGKCQKTCTEGELVFRFVGENTAFFYAFFDEAQLLFTTNPFWTYEGPVFCASAPEDLGLDRVIAYRYFNNSETTHVFTASTQERTSINIDPAWQLEGEAFVVREPAATAEDYFSLLNEAFLAAEVTIKQNPLGYLAREQAIIQYENIKATINSIKLDISQFNEPEGTENIQEIVVSTFELTDDYLSELLVVLNNSTFTDTEIMNEINLLINETAPQLEELLSEFEAAITEYLNS